MVDDRFGGHLLFIGDKRLQLRERHGDHAVIDGAVQQAAGVDVLFQKRPDAGGIDASVFQRRFDICLQCR